MIKSTREGLLLCLAFTTGAALMAAIAGLPWPIPASSALAAVILFLMVLREPREPEQLDVWAMHRRVMAASGQGLPMTPTLSHGFLLYLALTAEELAETFDASLTTMMARPLSLSADHQIIELTSEMIDIRDAMQQGAVRMRQKLARITPAAISYTLTAADAAAILDGVSDVMVTTAGMAESAGLPGMAAYVEVQTSNWSKTNPSTGVIDKTPDGKWIKGVNYRPPNLAAVVVNHMYRPALHRLDADDGTWNADGRDDYPNCGNPKLGPKAKADSENPGYYPGQ